MRLRRRPSFTAICIAAAAAAAATLLFTAEGCRRAAIQEPDALALIRERGTLRVAVEGVYLPWNFHGDDGKLTGFDVELARILAEKLGVEAEFVETVWDSLLPGLADGSWDIVCNEVEPTDDRAATYDFTVPYANITTVVVVRADRAADFPTPAALRGKTVAGSITSTYIAIARANGAYPVPTDTVEETMKLVEEGSADAMLDSNITFLDYKRVHPDTPLAVACENPDPSPVAIPMAKGEATESLRNALDAAIEELREDGTLRELSVRFFGGDLTK